MHNVHANLMHYKYVRFDLKRSIMITKVPMHVYTIIC